MGLDWRSLGWAEYQMHLAGWNAHHSDGKERPAPDLSRLKRFVEAHSIH